MRSILYLAVALVILLLTQGAVPDKVFASTVPEIIKAIESSYERKKEKEAWKKAMNSTRYGRVAYVGEGRGYFEGPYADELKRMSPEEREKVLKEEEKQQFRIWKKEGFPYVEKIITACEEYAGYFLFWEAYYNSYKDVKKARDLIEEIAKRYPEATAGRIASSIIDKAKTEKELISQIQEAFKKLQNPVESYEPRKGEPPDSIMNSLKTAISSSLGYKRWRKDSSSFLSGKEVPTSAYEFADFIIRTLDEEIAAYYFCVGHEFAFNGEGEEKKEGLAYLNILVTRYPHTANGSLVKKYIEQIRKNVKKGGQ